LDTLKCRQSQPVGEIPEMRDVYMIGAHTTAFKKHPGMSFGGDLSAFYSIRVNDQWRLIFRWLDGDAYDVQIVDYH
jgi:plasmid maintenance system killer protein